MPVEFELPTRKVTPPGEFDYTQPETGGHFHSHDWVAFSRAVRDHRLANHIPISPQWEEELVDQMCRDNPKWPCRRIDAARHKRKGFSFAAAMGFLNFLKSWVLKHQGQYVSQEEAERRAAICARCDFNKPMSHGCGGCMTALLRAISTLKGGRKTSKDSELNACQICSCSNAVQVWMPIEPLVEAAPQDVRQTLSNISWCWKKLP